ncbi:hypothetical protein ACIBEJ_12635 [Nonomuraea sp. NPDC050790]|uniref:hypothetical protein n=1 Tax=Nonomuraea sp. NPDC050790 TaxID=3364371 RepID=UPI00378ECF5E
MGARQHLDGLARSARSLHDTVGELHAALAGGDERRAGYARDRLADQARTALGDSGAYGFEPPRAAGAPDPGPPDPGALLAEAARDLALSQALISAAQPDGRESLPRGPQGPGGALRDARDSLGRLAAALEPSGDFGFEAATGASPDLPTAVAALRQEAAACLDRIHERSAGVASSALAKIPGVSTVTTTAQEMLDSLGVAAIAGTLTKLAAQALSKALTALHRLIPLGVLDRLNTAVSHLADGLGQDKAAGPLLVSALLGTDNVRAALDERLTGDTLERARLDGARAELAELGDRFGGQMDLLAIAITVSTGLVAWLASPPAAGAVAALLLGVVLVLAADYADAWPAPATVRGVRTVVEEATA